MLKLNLKAPVRCPNVPCLDANKEYCINYTQAMMINKERQQLLQNKNMPTSLELLFNHFRCFCVINYELAFIKPEYPEESINRYIYYA